MSRLVAGASTEFALPMSTMDPRLHDPSARAEDLARRYERLAFDLGDGGKGAFISGWQCENPFAADLLAEARDRSLSYDHTRYVYFDDEPELVRQVQSLHRTRDGHCGSAVFCGPGSSSLLSGFASLLRRIGVHRVYYLPPLYFTLQLALARFSIEAVPVAEHQAFEADFRLKLPNEHSAVLIVTDPVWYAGAPMQPEVWDSIVEWQKAYESVIFVDGSLQYMPWPGAPRNEPSARLDPAKTFRLICPSKQLAVHGYRFAYVLCPPALERDYAWVCTNIYGPVNVDSIAFAYAAVTAMRAGSITFQLMERASRRHAALRRGGLLRSEYAPSCGYFVFEEITAPLPVGYLQVDQRYFDLVGHGGKAKVNLLSPELHLLMDQLAADDRE